MSQLRLYNDYVLRSKGRLTNRFPHAKRPLDAFPDPPLQRQSVHPPKSIFLKEIKRCLGPINCSVQFIYFTNL